MTEYEQNQKIRYGDIIYIEFINSKNDTRNLLSGDGFNITRKYFVEIEKFFVEGDSIYLKDLEDNLFLIFPKMKDEFMRNKTILINGLSSVREKIKTSKSLSYDTNYKKDIGRIITAFQEAKEDVYNENEKFLKEIGQPICFQDEYILIHLSSQCFVKRNEQMIYKHKYASALVLTPTYSDECVFFSTPWSSLDLNAKYLLSNQNLLICKKERNIWNSNHFLTIKPVIKSENNNLNDNENVDNKYSSFYMKKKKKKKYREIELKEGAEGINEKKIRYVLDFAEGEGHPFQIKICSDYISPSSSNLSFATPVWLVCQNIDRYLNITPLTKIDQQENNEIVDYNNMDNNNLINNQENNNNNVNIEPQVDIVSNLSDHINNCFPSNDNYNSIVLNNNNQYGPEISRKLNNNTDSVINNQNQNINNNVNNNPNLNNNINNLGYNSANNYNNNTQINNNNLKNTTNDNYNINNLNIFDDNNLTKTIYLPRGENNNTNNLFVNNYYINNKADPNQNSNNIQNNNIQNNNIQNNNINNQNFSNNNNYPIKQKTNLNEKSKRKFKISFEQTNKQKSINNINGLFYIEQYDENDINTITDEYLKRKLQLKMDLKMNSFVEYHKIIRFRHVTTKKYLGFEEKVPESEKNQNNNEMRRSNYNSLYLKNTIDKTSGSLVLLDTPNENCDWKFMQSYIVLDTKEYYEAKNKGLEKITKLNRDENEKLENKEEPLHKIKNKEILRIFHIKTNKFLCFDEVNNKLSVSDNNDIYQGLEPKKIYVNNLSLSKIPYDSDLVRLMPSNSGQTWEINLVLYLNKLMKNQLKYIFSRDFRTLFGIEKFNTLSKSLLIEGNGATNENNQDNKSKDSNNKIELKILREKTAVLKDIFKNLRDYCLNEYYRKFDITISPGKPVFYRQQFLYDQGFLRYAFKFLEQSKNFKLIYNDYLKFVQSNIERNKQLKVNLKLTSKTEKNKYTKKTNKKVMKFATDSDSLIGDIFQNMNDSIKYSFEFIESICKKNNNIKKIVFNHKKIFLDYVLEYEEAAKCFIDLIKDKENIMNILSSNDGEEGGINIVDQVLFHLNTTEKYNKKNLETLSKFLKINDKGITSNQQYIFEAIFYNGFNKFLIKVKPLYNDIQFLVVYRDENKTFIEKNLVEFCDSPYLNELGLVSYFAEQLNLYANLCYGRNYVCIERIRKLFPLDHLIFHISKVNFNQEILSGLINILNFVYIDIEPHITNICPSLVKRVNPNLTIERNMKEKTKTYIPLDKLNLILCISLFLLNNMKYGKILVNSANINMIYNIIKFSLYENVIYSKMDIEEAVNNNLDRRLHNLKDEVKYNVLHGEEILIDLMNSKQNDEKLKKRNQRDLTNPGEKGDLDDEYDVFNKEKKNEEEDELENSEEILHSFYYKIGNRYIEYCFERPAGEEYLLFVLSKINDYFLGNLILNNIDINTENKNILSQNFRTTSNNNILTESNINFLMEKLIEIREIFSSKDEGMKNNDVSIMYQIEKVINYILDIKKEDMSIYLLENILRQNYNVVCETMSDPERLKDDKNLIDLLKSNFYSSPNIKEILMDDEQYYYQLYNRINYNYFIPPLLLTSNDTKTISPLLDQKKDNDETNKRLLNNSLYSEDSELSSLAPNKTNILQNNDIYNYYYNNNNNNINKANRKFDYYTNTYNYRTYSDQVTPTESSYNNFMNYFIINQNSPPSFFMDNKNGCCTSDNRPQINSENFFLNSVIFKNLQELLIKILEISTNGKMIKISLRLFIRLYSQRKELFEYIKNVLLIHKQDEIERYYQCYTSIKDLGILAEKTENWMIEERTPENMIAIKDPTIINIDEIKDEQKDFFTVYYTLNQYFLMIVDKKSNFYYSYEKVKLMQKIFHSFCLEELLMSLLREITQSYTINNSEEELLLSKHDINEINKKKDNKKKEQQKQNYKIALEKLTKIIYKILTTLVHEVYIEFSEDIIEIVANSKEYDFLLELGYFQFLVELSNNDKFVSMEMKYLVDVTRNQLKEDNFSIIQSFFYEYESLKLFSGNNNIKGNITQNYYKKIIKQSGLGLKLMKNIIKRISDEVYLGLLLSKFLGLINIFIIFTNNSHYVYSSLANFPYGSRQSIPGSGRKSMSSYKFNYNVKEPDNIYDNIYLYNLKFIYYLLKVAFRILKKNQQLMQLIINALNLAHLKKYVLEMPKPFNKSKLEYIIDNQSFAETKLFAKLNYYFKVKFIGVRLILSIERNNVIRSKEILKLLEKYYFILNEDLDYVFYFNKLMNKCETSLDNNFEHYNLVFEIYRKNIYKYFFIGIYPLIFYHGSRFKRSLFRNNTDYQNMKVRFSRINTKWYELFEEIFTEKNKRLYKKLILYMAARKKQYRSSFFSPDLTADLMKKETNLSKYFSKLKSGLVGPEANKLFSLFYNVPTYDKRFIDTTIYFTKDILGDVENNEVIQKTINKEAKITARHIKNKINFHQVMKKSIAENNSDEDNNIKEYEDFHLINVFFKFIQENYNDKKYYEMVNSLIDLMAKMVFVTPEILRKDNNSSTIKSSSFYFQGKLHEYKDIFQNHIQKLFLNNGAIEIFLRIVCHNEISFHQNIFPPMINFLIAILDGGNTIVQRKFTQLFTILPNSDYFFNSIYQTMINDIYFNLRGEVTNEEPKIDNQNLNIVTSTLRFLQLLAENHNTVLQNFLRDQKTNRISYNFVNILVEYLSMLLGKLGNINDSNENIPNYFSSLYLKRIIQLLDTLCEFLQGPCAKNQESLMDTKVIELFNKMMGEIKIKDKIEEEIKENEEEYSEEQETDFNKVSNSTFTFEINSDIISNSSIDQKPMFYSLSDYEKSLLLFKISLVLLSIIEGRKTKDNVIKKVLRDLDYKTIYEKCSEMYEKLKKDMTFFLFIDDVSKNEKDLENKIVAEAGFNFYFLMESLVELETEETELKKYSKLLLSKNVLGKIETEYLEDFCPNAEKIEEAMSFYIENSLNIEILKDDKVFKVYCPKLQFFSCFDRKMKKKFEDSANRSSIQTKLLSLISDKNEIYWTLKQIYNLQQKFGSLKFLILYPDMVQLVGLILVVLMNILIFLGYNAESDADQKDVIDNVEFFGFPVALCKSILLFLGIFVGAFSIIIFFEFVLRDAILIYNKLYEDYIKSYFDYSISHMRDLEIYRARTFLKGSGYHHFFKMLMIYSDLFINWHVLYALCYLIFAILGMAVHSFFFAFHLIEFIKSQPILQYVVRSFYEPLAQLVYTYIFFFILIYFYSLIIFYRFYNLMPDNTCNSPLICMLAIYSNTFTSGGNLGNFIDEKEESENVSGDMERYILDISYTIIMVWLVWQMVSGLIVDTFNSLRSEREEKEEDMETTCFICGLDREKIGKYYVGKDGFDNHLQDHSIENYLFYMFYLEDKDPSEYSGLESYIKELIDKESITWFPIERCFKIEEWENKRKNGADYS